MGPKQNYKKPLLILSALFIGAGIIFVALKGDSLTGTKLAVNTDWQSSLEVIPALDATTTLAVQRGLKAAENVSDGQTLTATDLFSRKLFASYVAVKKGMATGTALTDDQVAGMADHLITNVVATTTTYSLKDVRAINDNSDAAAIAYSQSVAKILNNFAALKTREASIISDALNSGDEKKVAPLADIMVTYKKLESDLLAVKTPANIAPLHLRLVQGYATVRGAITMMHDSFTDPVAILVAFSQYKNGMRAIASVAKDYSTTGTGKQ
jgi:hypothetical protein